MERSERQPAPVVAAFGEFVLRLHSSNNQRFIQTVGYDAYYGGAEANVCVLLSRLGNKTEYISRVPANDLAYAGIQQLKAHGVGTSLMQFGGDILGMYFTESGNHLRSSRVIYNRSGSAFATLQPGTINWHELLKNSQYFHWSGVSAAISASAAAVCQEAITAALNLGITISADFNYRSTLWQYGEKPSAVMPALLHQSKIVVADLDSAELYFGIATNKNSSLPDRFKVCCDALLKKIPFMEYLGMSFRSTTGLTHSYSGALMAHGKYFFYEGFQLPYVTDQIGSGDAFTAGLLHGIINNVADDQLLPFAVACGALKQSIMGDWALISNEEVQQFIHTGSSGRIVR